MKLSFSQAVDFFLDSYQLLSKGYRAVWRYMQWICKNFRNNFVCLDTIAEKCEMSKRQVQRALKFFTDMDWLKKIKRPYRSNLYHMDPEFLELNLENSAIFLRPVHQCVHQGVHQDVHQNVHVLRSHSNGSSPPRNTDSVEASSSENENTEKKTIPLEHVEGLSYDAKIELSMKFDEYVLRETIRRTRWYQNAGNTIRNMSAWIEKTANNIIYKRGRLVS